MNLLGPPAPGPPGERGSGAAPRVPTASRGELQPPPLPPPRSRGPRAPARRARRLSGQAGPRSPRRSQPGPGAPPPPPAARIPPSWTPRLAFALKTQEMHDSTGEVEPFPSLRSPGQPAGGRLWERGGGATRPQPGRARGEVRFPETGFYLRPLTGPAGWAGRRAGAERRSSCPQSLAGPRANLGVTLGCRQAPCHFRPRL